MKMKCELQSLARLLRRCGADDAAVERGLTRYLAIRYRVATLTVESRTAKRKRK